MTDNGFASFYQERFSRTVVLLIAMGASRADAEDATQTAMISAWQQWASIRQPASWVRAVAVRAFWKRVSAHPSAVPLEESNSEPAIEADLSIFAEQQQYVLCLLRGLPPQQRAVAAMHYDGATCEEIADAVGISTATVRSHWRHARKTLKELIASGEI